MRPFVIVLLAALPTLAPAQGTLVSSSQVRVRDLPVTFFVGPVTTLDVAFSNSFSTISALVYLEGAVVNAMDAAVIRISDELPVKLDAAVSSYLITGDDNIQPHTIPPTAFTNGAIDASVYVASHSLSPSNIMLETVYEAKLADQCLGFSNLKKVEYYSDQFVAGAATNEHLAPGSISARTLSPALKKISGPGIAPGSIRPFITTNAPAGWVKCDGRLVPLDFTLETSTPGLLVTNPFARALAVAAFRFNTEQMGIAYTDADPSTLGLGDRFTNCTVIAKCARLPDLRGLFPRPSFDSGPATRVLASVLPIHKHAIAKLTPTGRGSTSDVSANKYNTGMLNASTYSDYMGVSINPHVGPDSPLTGFPSSTYWGKTKDWGIYMRTTSPYTNYSSTETAPINMAVIYRIYLGREAVEYGLGD